jgi:uncharacterized membrane protein YgdD (TMEM256/DUF423 family)
MNNNDEKFWLTATILGFLAVGIGAFGAHGLKGIITDNQLPIERLDTFKTGVSYHFYHTFALLAALMMPISQSYKKKAASFFIIGILLFSGSLYLLTIREFIPIPIAILGPITPIGGLFFMIGWATLALGVWKNKND